MFNPFVPFEAKYLPAFKQKGVVAFVKQSYKRGKSEVDSDQKPAFLLAQYNEAHLAKNHFDSIAHDADRRLLEVNNPEDWRELQRLGGSQAEAYVFVTLKRADAEKLARQLLDKKLHAFIDHKLQWRVSREEGIKFSLGFTDGEIYVILSSGGRSHKVKIEEIESQKGYVL